MRVLGREPCPVVGVGEKPVAHYRGATIHADPATHVWVADRLAAPGTALQVLDLGCGAGALAQRLADLGHHVHAVDNGSTPFSPDSSVTFVQGDLEEPRLVEAVDAVSGGQRFDAVLLIEVIEHLRDPERVFLTARDLLTHEGSLLVTTPHITSFLSRAVFAVHGRFFQFWPEDESYGHLRPISWWELNARLARCGFSVQEQQGVGSLPIIWIHGGIAVSLFHILAALLSPFMRGPKWGWALATAARLRPSADD